MRRELMEEVAIDETREAPSVAVINDDSTEVGYVHFGVVHILRVDDENVAGPEAASLAPSLFLSLRRLKTCPVMNPGHVCAGTSGILLAKAADSGVTVPEKKVN